MTWIRATILILLLSSNVPSIAQSCSQKLEEAKRAYYNGQFDDVHAELSGCLNQMTKVEKVEALKLITDTYLLQGKTALADSSLYQLLTVDPEYVGRESDLVEFQNLYKQYKIQTQFAIGVSVGFLQPDYLIMRHQSYATESIEPNDYDEKSGFSFGISGDIAIINEFFLSSSLLWEYSAFEQSETILGYQSVYSKERYHRLNVPVQLRYGYSFGKFKSIVGAGFSGQYLLSARAELDHSPIEPEYPKPFIGVPKEASNYNLSEQRKAITGSWVFSAGVQRKIQSFILELRFTYNYGVNNMVNTKHRLSDPVLLEDYAYVPDDFKMDSYVISISLLRNYTKAKKR